MSDNVIVRFAPANTDRQVEVRADTNKLAFVRMAKAYELFSVSKCGLCEGTNVRPSVRSVKGGESGGFDAHEWRCDDCGASLKVGVGKDNATLFIRWNEEWKKYEKGDGGGAGGGGSDQPQREEPPI